MVSRTAQLPNVHFHKDWKQHVKTWFNQPARKLRRRLAREKKVAKSGIRPVGMLRPAVRPPTQRYNLKIRGGRGFTLEELRSVNLSAKFAGSIGIAVDHRRRNRSHESLELNKRRLKAYLDKLVVFPRGGVVKSGIGGIPADTPKLRAPNTKQVKIATAMPIKRQRKRVGLREITPEDRKFCAYATLRKARCDAKNVGKHAKRLAEEKTQK